MEWYLPNDGDDFFTGKGIYCENGENPGTFVGVAGNISGRTRTTSYTTLTAGDQGTGWKTLSSLVDVVQEVVTDNAGTGDALVLIVDSTSSDRLDIQAWDYGDHSRAAKLHIEYSAGAAGRRILIIE